MQLITLNKINLEILDNKLSWSRVQPKYARLDSNVNNSGMKVVELTGAPVMCMNPDASLEKPDPLLASLNKEWTD